MDLSEKVHDAISQLPEPLIQEVLDFIGLLSTRHHLSERTPHDENPRQRKEIMTEQTLASFHGSGKGGSTARLLAERRTDLERGR
ncbi:MAG: DUF2281 domain-containing protein [Magnetococcales bacterium]|nr:DUF2281 domain-containing protein [Magnetococcales bacterium]